MLRSMRCPCRMFWYPAETKLHSCPFLSEIRGHSCEWHRIQDHSCELLKLVVEVGVFSLPYHGSQVTLDTTGAAASLSGVPHV